MSDSDQGNGAGFNLLNSESTSPIADFSPNIDKASKGLDNFEIQDRDIINDNRVDEESFINITIEDVILVTLFKFSNPINFIQKNEHFTSKKLIFNYQKYNRDIYIVIKFIPYSSKETIGINIKFYLDKSEWERDYIKNHDQYSGEINNFQNNPYIDKYHEITKNTMNIFDGNDYNLIDEENQEFPFEILLNIYKLENECFIKVKKEKIIVLGKTYTFENDDYLKIDDLLYEKLIDPLIIRIKITCQTRIPKKCDEYIGLINEGNTCYMNSFIQTLHYLPIVNKILYDQKYIEGSVISNFQKIFFLLKTEKLPIKITNLFHSLGWEKSYWNSQQDVQETFFIIFDKINEEIKNYNNNNFTTFSSLFEGKVTNVICCEEKGFEKKIEENFSFLQIDLEYDTLIQNIEKLFNVEMLNGDNKYKMDDGTVCDAIKSTSLSTLPPILLIQLKRFCYLDNKNSKIMKKIVYEETLDLTNYYSSKETKNQLPTYDLYAVIIHKGDSENGHYFVYIKNTKYDINNPFIKFDDRSVTYATREEVFFENFLKNSIEIDKKGFFYKLQEESKNTPYILIYTDSSKKDFIFENYPVHKIPSEISRILNKRERIPTLVQKPTSIYSENRNGSSHKFVKKTQNPITLEESGAKKITSTKDFFNRMETNNSSSESKKIIEKNGLSIPESSKGINNIDSNIRKFIEKKKDILRTYKIPIYKNKTKDVKEIEISISCDKKITVNDFLVDVIKKYNLSYGLINHADLVNAKLFLKSKIEIFDKFLNEQEEIQDILVEINQNKRMTLSIVLIDAEEIIEFENFLKEGVNSKRYFNINFPHASDRIPPCFSNLNIDNFNDLNAKSFIQKLQMFIKENYNLYIETTQMYFIRAGENVDKSLADIPKNQIEDYYLKILQKDNINKYVKIFVKD